MVFPILCIGSYATWFIAFLHAFINGGVFYIHINSIGEMWIELFFAIVIWVGLGFGIYYLKFLLKYDKLEEKVKELEGKLEGNI